MIEKAKIILVVCLFVTVGFSYSQNRISGKLTDESLEALAFANIVLYQSENTEAITGTVSDENGFYSFENVANGSYWLEISMLGFETKKSGRFVLSQENNAIELNFTLKEESQTLNEVVIKSTRPVIRQTAEKLVVDLEKSQMLNL